MKQLVYPVLAALALTGCVSGVSSKLPESHPANPKAPPSSVAVPASMLMAGSQGLVLPIATNQMKMDHGQHQPTPSGKSTPQSAEHQH